ncbi:ATP-binding protein [Streptomyces vinaceus]|uniref:ATP-binding protein n=1 Tax=Streptomyces vinaceus TaxID=1960 RepID=UPI0038237BA4
MDVSVQDEQRNDMNVSYEAASRRLPDGHPHGAIRHSRDLVKGMLESAPGNRGRAVTGDRAHDVMLVVSELVTNAYLHAGGAVEVWIGWQGDDLRVEVEDSSPRHPREPEDSLKGEGGGFGCQLIEALTDGWGVCATRTGRTGKAVYARFSFED